MKAIIVDDERLARNELKNLLNAFDEIEIIGEASNADEGIELVQKHQPDLIFLDIQMPEKNGFDMLAELDHPPKVVFITAYDEYALKAFEADAEDYLLKPIDEVRLKECIQKVVEQEEENGQELHGKDISKKKILSKGDHLFLKDGDKCFFIQTDDILLFQSEGNYVKVLFDNGKILILRSLNALEERLDPFMFFRANRKHLINLNRIEGVETWFNGGLMLSLSNGEHKIEVSRRQAIRFKEVFSL